MFVIDIACPECGRASPVRKISLGEYLCGDCDRSFTHEDVE